MRTALWIGLAFVAGVLGAALVAPRLASSPIARSPSASPTPEQPGTEPTDDPAVFAQPLVAGCSVARDDVYVVAHGGGIVRFDGRRWSVIDGTLRDLRAIDCRPDLVVAVGDGGRIVRIDPVRREIRSDVVGDTDLYAVALSDEDVVYAAGADQLVLRFAAGGWQRLGRGEGEIAWRAVLVAGANEVWFAGDRGVRFVFDGRRFNDRSIPNGPDLLALGARGVGPVAGAADGRLFGSEGAAGGEAPARLGGPVRAIFSPDMHVVYYAADRVWAQGPAGGAFVDTTLGCPPLSVFGTAADDVWVLGRRGERAGIAHFDGRAWAKVGTC